MTRLDADRLHDEWLTAVREMPYSEYLRTDWWQRFRTEALRRAGNRCQLCGAESAGRGFLQVHHNTYARLGCERPEDCVVLCEDCHQVHHEDLPQRE